MTSTDQEQWATEVGTGERVGQVSGNLTRHLCRPRLNAPGKWEPVCGANINWRTVRVLGPMSDRPVREQVDCKRCRAIAERRGS